MEGSLRQQMKITSAKLIEFVGGMTLVGQVKTIFKDQKMSNKSIDAID